MNQTVSTTISKSALKQQFIEDFPGLSATIDDEPVLYLDNAATTLKPSMMVKAMSDYYLGISANIHRGKHVALEDVSNKYENVRYKVANLIGCSGNEVVFLSNTTEAINVVANGLSLCKDDTVLCMKDAHHSNLLPWQQVANVEFINLTASNEVDMAHYQSLLAAKPKLVALTHCSNTTGVYIDLETMVKLAKDAGAIVMVDGAQSVPHRKINVKDLDIDFLAFSAHKMLGPTGLGVLFGKYDALNELKPSKLGGGVVDWVEYGSYELRKVPHRFEAGTPHIAGVLGLGAAIDYLNNMGWDVIEAHDTRMGKMMLAEALKRDYLTPLNGSLTADRGAVITVSIDNLKNLDDVARYLSDSFGIMCRNGSLCAQPFIDGVGNGQVIRASAYIYNTEEEIHYFFESLDQIISLV